MPTVTPERPNKEHYRIGTGCSCRIIIVIRHNLLEEKEKKEEEKRI